jgi:hypothetical protein
MSEADPPPAAPVAAVPAAPPAAAAPVVTPPRIKSFTLCDFRAFAGPEPVTFNLDGKNLLIYGENGAGKSSVFHALDEFFALPSPLANNETRRSRLASLANRFTQIIRCKVHRDFWDEQAVRQPAGSEIDVRECIALKALKAGAQIKPDVEPAIKDVKQARKVVLNQFSHSTPVNLADIEVKSAIDAVEALQKAFRDHIPTKEAAVP